MLILGGNRAKSFFCYAKVKRSLILGGNNNNMKERKGPESHPHGGGEGGTSLLPYRGTKTAEQEFNLAAAVYGDKGFPTQELEDQARRNAGIMAEVQISSDSDTQILLEQRLSIMFEGLSEDEAMSVRTRLALGAVGEAPSFKKGAEILGIPRSTFYDRTTRGLAKIRSNRTQGSRTLADIIEASQDK